MTLNASIIGTGHYLPENTLDNAQLSKMVDTNDEWIQQRVGITSRHIANETETTTFMATRAAEQALAAAKLSADQLELIICATSTADYLMPSVASQVQMQLGIAGCMAFDVSAACSGFIYILTIAEQFIKAGKVKNVLVIGSERMSRVTDWSDRATCVLFGDGAGAAVLTATEDNTGILASKMHADGKDCELLYVNNSLPKTAYQQDTEPAYLRMQGRAVFKQAVQMMGTIVDEVLDQAGYTKSDIDWLIPHQANERIIKATADKLGMSMDQVVLTLGEQGNTSAATIGLALDIAVRDGRVQPGQLVLLEAFGAGFVWGALLIRL